MLTGEDTPTIRLAINRRLGTLPGVAICDIKFERYKKGEMARDIDSKLMLPSPCAMLRVGVLATVSVGEGIVTKSVFDLPDPFEHGHLLAEIDQIAEQWKRARRDVYLADLPVSEEKFVPGTGTRGLWSRYGMMRP